LTILCSESVLGVRKPYSYLSNEAELAAILGFISGFFSAGLVFGDFQYFNN
jgi:hypothetical protein